MSNALAIAAVTLTLRNLLTLAVSSDSDLADTQVTARHPDRARDTITANQLNLFLYGTAPNAAWRNREMPRQVKPGETGQPPLALTLHYLVSAYGRDNDDVLGHRLLGYALSTLHDHPLLSPADIRAAIPAADLQRYDLYDQVERVRITPQPLSVEEMSKLWTTFQTNYRLSAGYEVSVVLIESRRPVRAPLPVLAQGPGDSGPTARADLVPPFPTIEAVSPPASQPAARLGETLTLRGHDLHGDSVAARFSHQRWDDPIERPVEPGATSAQVAARIPDATDDPAIPADWPAGIYGLALRISRAGEADRLSNEAPFALAPRITTPLPLIVARDGSGAATIALDIEPQLWPEQQGALLLGSMALPLPPRTTRVASITLTIPDAPPGDHFLRLRVDGVDSLLVDHTTSPPTFDTTHQVTIT